MPHFLRILLLAVLLLTGMFLPFFPGQFDSTAVMFSFLIIILGFTGWIFVPIGLLWMFFSRRSLSSNDTLPLFNNFIFTRVTLYAGCLIVSLLSLSTIVSGQKSGGTVFLVLSGYLLWKGFSYLKEVRETKQTQLSPIPYYLVILPLVISLSWILFNDHAVSYSRSIAIRNSRPLIEEIESYYKRHNHYPVSLLAVHNDIQPRVIGIEQFHYQPAGESYNLYFEQFAADLSAREFVMYNPLDQQVMTSHDLDLLQFDGPQLEIQRGYFAVHDLDIPHWKYFWFD